jgi:hypothetical protein
VPYLLLGCKFRVRRGPLEECRLGTSRRICKTRVQGRHTRERRSMGWKNRGRGRGRRRVGGEGEGEKGEGTVRKRISTERIDVGRKRE